MTKEEIIADEKYHTCGRCQWEDIPFICHRCKWGEDTRRDLWNLKEDAKEGMTVTKTYCDRCRKEVIRPVERRLYLSGLGREGGYDLCNSCYDELCNWFIEKDKHETIIEDMPSVTPKARWIPVSESLPEDIKPVIITWKNTDPKSYYQYIVGKHFIGTAYYKNGKWFWYSSVTEDLLAEYGRCDSEEFDEAIEVIAWMPLPQPYKAESEEENDE